LFSLAKFQTWLIKNGSNQAPDGRAFVSFKAMCLGTGFFLFKRGIQFYGSRFNHHKSAVEDMCGEFLFCGADGFWIELNHYE
jgi:hypothetical protein